MGVDQGNQGSGAWRFVIYVLMFLAWAVCYLVRTNISNAFTVMCDGLAEGEVCAYEWSKNTETRGFVLGVFYYGYFVGQIPACWLCNRIGASRVLAIAVGFSCAMAILTPYVATSVPLLSAVRVAMGTVEAFTYPAVASLCSRWIPKTERSLAIQAIQIGGQFGVVISLYLTPHTIVWGGWRLSFQLYAGIGFAWCALWLLLSSDGPHDHRFISVGERDYIMGDNEIYTSLLSEPESPRQARDAELSLASIGRVLRCPAVWALMTTWFAGNWTGYVLIAWLPTYFNQQWHVHDTSVGWLAALPYLCFMAAGLCAGYAADALINSTRFPMRTITVRKLFYALGSLPQGMLLALIVVSSNIAQAEALLTAASVVNALTTCGPNPLVLEMGGTHAVIVQAVANACGTIPGFVGVHLSGWLVQTTGSWTSVFLITAALQVVGFVVFLTFASAENQFDKDTSA